MTAHLWAILVLLAVAVGFLFVTAWALDRGAR